MGGEAISLENSINLFTVEVSFGFLSGYFLCFLITGVSDTPSKGKAAIKSLKSEQSQHYLENLLFWKNTAPELFLYFIS